MSFVSVIVSFLPFTSRNKSFSILTYNRMSWINQWMSIFFCTQMGVLWSLIHFKFPKNHASKYILICRAIVILHVNCYSEAPSCMVIWKKKKWTSTRPVRLQFHRSFPSQSNENIVYRRFRTSNDGQLINIECFTYTLNEHIAVWQPWHIRHRNRNISVWCVLCVEENDYGLFIVYPFFCTRKIGSYISLLFALIRRCFNFFLVILIFTLNLHVFDGRNDKICAAR